MSRSQCQIHRTSRLAAPTVLAVCTSSIPSIKPVVKKGLIASSQSLAHKKALIGKEKSSYTHKPPTAPPIHPTSQAPPQLNIPVKQTPTQVIYKFHSILNITKYIVILLFYYFFYILLIIYILNIIIFYNNFLQKSQSNPKVQSNTNFMTRQRFSIPTLSQKDLIPVGSYIFNNSTFGYTIFNITTFYNFNFILHLKLNYAYECQSMLLK